MKKSRLLVLLIIASAFSLLVTTFTGYFTSVATVKKSVIENELPLISDNVFSAIRRDLVEPTLVSSVMANDAFLHAWARAGEQDIDAITQYLNQIKTQYNATTSFFISDQTKRYYYAKGILKTLSANDEHDVWYFNFLNSPEVYETSLDTDQANQNQLTIFINYKVFDANKRYLGVCGFGLTVHEVSQLLAKYQRTFQRQIYFVDPKGDLVLSVAGANKKAEKNIRQIEGLNEIADTILAKKTEFFEYRQEGKSILLNVRYLPELQWFVFVEKDIDDATSVIRRSLYFNLLVVLLSVILLAWLMTNMVNRYHGEVERIAITDSLTGLPNRTSLEVISQNLIKDTVRKPMEMAMLLIDLDYFKRINDQYGHIAGDQCLKALAEKMKSCVRETDYIFRWGGEEFLVLLRDCNLHQARIIAEKIRVTTERMQVVHAQKTIVNTVSVGLAVHQPKETFDMWLQRADMALRRAKSLGRNRVEF